MDDCFWPNSVDHDQQPSQPQPAQAVNSTGIRIQYPHHPAAQRCEAEQRSGIRSSQRGLKGMQATWACYLETLVRLSPTAIGGDPDELLQEMWREGNGQDV